MSKDLPGRLTAIVDLSDCLRDGDDGRVLMLPHLSTRQAESLVFLFEYLVSTGYYPTQRELLEHLGVHGTAAAVYLDPLVQKGYVVRQPDERRNVRLTDRALLKLERMGIDVETKLAHVRGGEPRDGRGPMRRSAT